MTGWLSATAGLPRIADEVCCTGENFRVVPITAPEQLQQDTPSDECLTRSPHRRGRAVSAARRGRAPWPSTPIRRPQHLNRRQVNWSGTAVAGLNRNSIRTVRGAISFNSSTHFRPSVPAGSLDRQLFAQHAICAVQSPLGEEPGEGGAFAL